MTPLSKYSFIALLGTVLGAYPHGNLVDRYYIALTKVGPFTTEPNQKIEFEFKYHHHNGERIQPYLKVFTGDDIFIFKDKGLIKTMQRRKPEYVNWTVYLGKHNLEKGVVFYLGYYNEEGRDINDTFAFIVYPIGINKVNPFKLEDMKYESKVYAYEIEFDSLDEHEYKSYYDFHGLVDYTLDTDYKYLYYPTCSFTYESLENNFSYEDAYIKFFDKKHLFNKWRTSSDGYKHVPLRLLYDKQTKMVDILMKNECYLNRDTMEVSDIYRNNFNMVGKFYLPFNFSKFADEYEFSVELIGVGEDKLDISYPIDFFNNKNFFGLCNNSNYCVIGGISK